MGGVHRYGQAAHTPNVLEAVLILSGTGTYLITLVYLLLGVGGLWLLYAERARGGLGWKVPVVLVALSVPILSFDGSLNPFPAYPNDVGVYFAAGGLCLARVWYWTLRVWRSPRVAAAARHADVASASAGSAAPAEP